MIETDLEDREHRANGLAALIDERGFARFPRVGWPDWDAERLRQARRELWDVLEHLRDSGREVELVEREEALVVRWAAQEQ